jgi:hypothetical protein
MTPVRRLSTTAWRYPAVAGREIGPRSKKAVDGWPSSAKAVRRAGLYRHSPAARRLSYPLPRSLLGRGFFTH